MKKRDTSDLEALMAEIERNKGNRRYIALLARFAGALGGRADDGEVADDAQPAAI